MLLGTQSTELQCSAHIPKPSLDLFSRLPGHRLRGTLSCISTAMEWTWACAEAFATCFEDSSEYMCRLTLLYYFLWDPNQTSAGTGLVQSGALFPKASQAAEAVEPFFLRPRLAVEYPGYGLHQGTPNPESIEAATAATSRQCQMCASFQA